MEKELLVAVSSKKAQYTLKWHKIVRNIGEKQFTKASQLVDRVGTIEVQDMNDHQWIPWLESGMKSTQIPAQKKTVTVPLESTNMEMSRKLSIRSLNGCHYIEVFLDFPQLELMYSSSDKIRAIWSIFTYNELFENEINLKVKRISLDREGEHVG